MLNKLFNQRKNLNGFCYAFYSFSYERCNSKALYEKLKIANMHFEYSGFYDETYKDYYGKFSTIDKKLAVVNFTDIVNITLHDKSIKSDERTIGIEFNISRPIVIAIDYLIGKNDFDAIRFIENIHAVFKIEYGFGYQVEFNEWSTGYAIGALEKSNGVINKSLLSKSSFDNWKSNCEMVKYGYLRDLYEQNILTPSHLYRNLSNDMTLKHFIDEKDKAGLKKITEEVFLWNIATHNIKEFKKQLSKYDLFI